MMNNIRLFILYHQVSSISILVTTSKIRDMHKKWESGELPVANRLQSLFLFFISVLGGDKVKLLIASSSARTLVRRALFWPTVLSALTVCQVQGILFLRIHMVCLFLAIDGKENKMVD